MTAFPSADNLQERIGYHFHDVSLLMQALTHASYANETLHGAGEDYERLEFLGDAVLEMVTSDAIFSDNPGMSEGEMTRLRASLVCEEALYERAEALGLKEYLRLGKGEEKTGGRNRASIISDVTEALIGAIYVDAGIGEARRFILSHILNDADHGGPKDYKTALQEMTQAFGENNLRYEVLGESGPAHDRIFECAVFLGDERLGTGKGSSKRKAQQMAAQEAITVLRQKK